MSALLPDDTSPRVDTTVTHRALGTLRTMLKEDSEVWVQISHSKYGTSEIQCTLQARAHWGSRSLPMDSVDDWIIKAYSPAPQLVRLWPWGASTYSGSSAFLELGAYEIVPDPDEVISGETIKLTIELTRRGILPGGSSRSLHFNGTMKVRNKAPNSLKWSQPGIEGEMRVRYTYERARAGGDDAYLQVERPCIFQIRQIGAPSSFHDILESSQSSIDDCLLILSLVSREPINWYQINAYPAAGKGRRLSYGIRRQIVPEQAPAERPWALIEFSTLAGGLFPRMVENLRQSPLSEAIRRAISFEAASWTQRSLENAFVLCQAALESVIGALEKDNPLLSEVSIPWKKINKALGEALSKLGEEERIPSEALDLLTKKLPEMRRPPVADQILSHANRLGVLTVDLWPKTVGFEQGLRSALKQRNLLVHAAHIEDPAEANSNLVRMRILAERFILAALGVKQEEIGRAHDQPVLLVNRR